MSTTTIGDAFGGRDAVEALKKLRIPVLRGSKLGGQISGTITTLRHLAKTGEMPKHGWRIQLNDVANLMHSANGSSPKIIAALNDVTWKNIFRHAERGELDGSLEILDHISEMDLGEGFKNARTRARDLAYRLRHSGKFPHGISAGAMKTEPKPASITAAPIEDPGVLNPDELSQIPELAKSLFAIEHSIKLAVLLPNGQTVERQIVDYRGKIQLRLRLSGMVDDHVFVVWVVDATSNRVCNILCGIGNLGINPKTVEGLTVHYLRFLLDAYTKANSKKPKVIPEDGGTISLANALKLQDEKLWQLGYEASRQLAKRGDSRDLGIIDGYNATIVRWDSDKRPTFTIRIRDKSGKGGAIIAWDKNQEPVLVSNNGRFNATELMSIMTVGDGTILRRAVAMAISTPIKRAEVER